LANKFKDYFLTDAPFLSHSADSFKGFVANDPLISWAANGLDFVSGPAQVVCILRKNCLLSGVKHCKGRILSHGLIL